MKVSSRHMCSTPKQFENSKRGDYVLTWGCLEVLNNNQAKLEWSGNQTAPYIGNYVNNRT